MLPSELLANQDLVAQDLVAQFTGKDLVITDGSNVLIVSWSSLIVYIGILSTLDDWAEST